MEPPNGAAYQRPAFAIAQRRLPSAIAVTTIQLHYSLLEVLDEAVQADGAARGNVQLYDATLGALRIVAQRGFEAPFLHLFERVRPDEPSVCSRAFRSNRRVFVADVTADPAFAPYLSIARRAGFRAVQSTPIRGESGEVVGVLSTHFARVHSLSQTAMESVDRCSERAAALIRRFEESALAS
jgi:GAF domain-containing protein